MIERICVIIPARGPAPTLSRCVASVLDCDYPDKEVIVIDDGISLKTLATLEAFHDRITIVHSGGRGPSHARNVAASKTRAAYLAFTDSDCIVDPRWLTALMDGFTRRPDAVSVGGIQEVSREAGAFEKAVFAFMRAVHFVADYARCPADQANLIEVEHNASCNVMYKRDVFLQEKGFREGLWPGEDVDLDYRLKEKDRVILFTASAVVYHEKPKTLGRFIKMMFAYGRAQGELVRIHGRLFRKIQLVPLVAFSVSAVLFMRPAAGLFLCAIAVAGVVLYMRSVIKSFLALNAFVSWNAGFLVGILRGPASGAVV